MNSCNKCSKSFSKKSNLNRHLKLVHSENIAYAKSVRPYQCLEGCEISFRCNKDLLKHLTDNHSFKLEVEELQFSSIEDFYSFLNQIQSAQHIQYVQLTGKKHGTSKDVIYFKCNRSGKYKTQSTSTRISKLQGTSKMNRNCTSEIVLTVNKSNGNVTAVYYKSHYGHAFQLQHLKVAKSDRVSIAQKLCQGVSVTRILDDNRENFNEDAIKRMDLLTRKDINNIKNSFNLEIQDGVRHREDALSVDLYIQECSSMENNPIVYYKPQGMQKESELSDKDFCLIVMNQSQEDLLIKFGKNIVAIDSTHGMNAYDFELTTLLVIDEWGEGFPGACMFTNRKDTYIFQLFFRKIRDKVGLLTPKVFMSDITNVFYNAWQIEMGTVPSHLYCAWHIDRAWQSNLNKIVLSETKKMVYHVLKTLQTTTCLEEFHKLIEKTVAELLENEETKKFGIYFKNNYSANYKQWAYCYRLNCGINTNMHLESMHKILKYIYLDAKKVKRLDKALHSLNKFIRDKVVERIIKKVKGKNSHHLQKIHSRHATAIKTIFKIIKSQETNDFVTWSVSVSSTSSESNNDYLVSQSLMQNICCNLICSFCYICIHSYTCTCPDFYIQNTICKHIHAVAVSNKRNVELRDFTVTEPNISNMCASEEVTKHLKTLSQDKNNLNQNCDSLIKTISIETLKLQNNISKIENTSILVHVAKTLRNENMFIETNMTEEINFKLKSKSDPPNKNISKQMRFFSTKKKRNINNGRISKPKENEINLIKKSVLHNVKFISNDPLLDHNYC